MNKEIEEKEGAPMKEEECLEIVKKVMKEEGFNEEIINNFSSFLEKKLRRDKIVRRASIALSIAISIVSIALFITLRFV